MLSAIVPESCPSWAGARTCPRCALTPEGAQALGIKVGDVEESLGYPVGFTSSHCDLSDRLRLLSSQVDGLDFPALRRLSRLPNTRRRKIDSPSALLSAQLAHSLVDQIESNARTRSAADPIVSAIGEQFLRTQSRKP